MKAITPSSVDVAEVDIPMLEQALADAAELGADKLQMPDDPVFGAREVKRAQLKLKAAKSVQHGDGVVDEVRDDDVDQEVPFNPDLKQLTEELKDAESKGDENRVKMITLVMIEQVRCSAPALRIHVVHVASVCSDDVSRASRGTAARLLSGAEKVV